MSARRGASRVNRLPCLPRPSAAPAPPSSWVPFVVVAKPGGDREDRRAESVPLHDRHGVAGKVGVTVVEGDADQPGAPASTPGRQQLSHADTLESAPAQPAQLLIKA